MDRPRECLPGRGTTAKVIVQAQGPVKKAAWGGEVQWQGRGSSDPNPSPGPWGTVCWRELSEIPWSHLVGWGQKAWVPAHGMTLSPLPPTFPRPRHLRS